MTITQTLMDIGTWSVGLIPETPGQILDLLDDWFSLITVTAQRAPLRLVDALDRPLYRGIYLGRDGPLSLSGVGVEWYAGSPSDSINQTDGFGPYVANLWSSVPVATVLSNITNKNGLSTNVLGVTGNITGGLVGTTRTGLDLLIAKQANCEWRIRPDLVVEIYKAADAAATPKALITTDPGGREPGGSTLSWHLSDIEPDIAVEDLRNRMVITYGSSTYATSPPSDSRKTYGGTQLEVAGYESIDSTSSTDATNRGNYLLGLKNGTIRSLTVHVDDYVPHAQLDEPDLLVGGSVSIYAPEYGLYDRTARPVSWRGSHVWPIKLRCTQAVTPFTAGTGVYLDNRHQGGEMVDITDYVAWEADGADKASDTVLTLGAPPRWWTGSRRPVAQS